MKVIPNVFDVRKVLSGTMTISPSDWLTNIFRPGGAGLGFSFFAEPYLNFALIGIICIPFLIGYIIKYFDRLGNRSPFIIAIYGVLIKSVLWTTRNDFYNVFRPFFWTLFEILIVLIIIESIRLKKVNKLT
jgi:oligosaccharide repeat unit polymerase